MGQGDGRQGAFGLRRIDELCVASGPSGRAAAAPADAAAAGAARPRRPAVEQAATSTMALVEETRPAGQGSVTWSMVFLQWSGTWNGSDSPRPDPPQPGVTWSRRPSAHGADARSARLGWQRASHHPREPASRGCDDPVNADVRHDSAARPGRRGPFTSRNTDRAVDPGGRTARLSVAMGLGGPRIRSGGGDPRLPGGLVGLDPLLGRILAAHVVVGDVVGDLVLVRRRPREVLDELRRPTVPSSRGSC